MNTPLEIKIEGKEELDLIIKKSLDLLLAALKKLDGQKLTKTDGSLLKNKEYLKELLPKEKHSNGNSYPIAYFEDSYGTLKVNFKICKSGGSYDVRPSTAYCEYFQSSIYFGEMKNSIFTISDQYQELHENGFKISEKIDLEVEKKKVEAFLKKKEELNEMLKNINYVVSDHYQLRRA